MRLFFQPGYLYQRSWKFLSERTSLNCLLMVMAGSRFILGSWKMMKIFFPMNFLFFAGESFSTSVPSILYLSAL